MHSFLLFAGAHHEHSSCLCYNVILVLFQLGMVTIYHGGSAIQDYFFLQKTL